MKLKYLLLILFFIVLFSASFFIYKFFFTPKLKTVKVGQMEILAEIADTEEKRLKGLSGRSSLPKNQGMFFISEKSDYYPFWTEGMLIPLDFIWIENNRVVEITKNVKPEDFKPPKVLVPKEKVNALLEVNAGLAEKFNLKEGDRVTF